MAGERVRVEVRARESRGSRDSRRLRREGLVPGVLYGRGDGAQPICVPERTLRHALSGPGGLHTVLDVVLAGQTRAHPAIVKDVQQDPLRGHVMHVDLQQVRLDQPIHASVVVQLVGEPRGVKEGGVLSQVTREVTVEALPMEIPEHLELDVSDLGVGDALRVADLATVAGVTFLDDPDETVLATVTMPTRVVEPEDMLAEGEDAEEVPSEQAPAGGSETPEPGADAAGAPGTAPG